LEERDHLGKKKEEKVIVMCPEFEDHDMGARMVSDFFTIAGYEAVFIGAKTPIKTILKAVENSLSKIFMH
jgi:methanogenic corrinoid protein MtbC1